MAAHLTPLPFPTGKGNRRGMIRQTRPPSLVGCIDRRHSIRVCGDMVHTASDKSQRSEEVVHALAGGSDQVPTTGGCAVGPAGRRHYAATVRALWHAFAHRLQVAAPRSRGRTGRPAGSLAAPPPGAHPQPVARGAGGAGRAGGASRLGRAHAAETPGVAGRHPLPRASTITAILHRPGRMDPVASAQHQPWHRFEHPAPNLRWQLDCKGHFASSGSPYRSKIGTRVAGTRVAGTVSPGSLPQATQPTPHRE